MPKGRSKIVHYEDGSTSGVKKQPPKGASKIRIKGKTVTIPIKKK